VEVTVRTLDVAAVTPEQWQALAALLDDAERARAARFRFPEDRDAYVAAHALLRAELSRRADRAPADWRFLATAQGKPYLADPPRDLRFSLTHARGMVAVAIAEGIDVGVDVEAADRRVENMKLAERFFAPQEAALLRALEGDARREAFCALWTLKEAVVKATGDGLSRGLRGFALALEPPRMVSPPDDGDSWTLAHWRCGLFRVAAAARGEGASLALEAVEPEAVAPGGR
jgi:4'-phosphopantetheinyl transferase